MSSFDFIKKQKMQSWLCQKISNWTPNKWKKKSFFKFNLITLDGRSFVRRVNKSFNRKGVTFIVKYGGGQVMYWGGFSGSGVDTLVQCFSNCAMRDF